MNAGLRQHGAEQRGLVFAITVVVGEDILRLVRPKTADANFDRHITYLALHEDAERANLTDGSCGLDSELRHLLLDLR